MSGDAPVLLRAWDEPGWIDALATDGREVFVAESSTPSVWSIDARGGATKTFDSGSTSKGSIGTRLFAWNNGVYFDTWRDEPFPLRWTSDDGTTTRSVATSNAVAFDPSGMRGFDTSAGVNFLIESISFADDARQSMIPRGSDVVNNVVTSARFLHVIVWRDHYVDRRMNLQAGTLDEVQMGDDDSAVSAGNGMCFDDTSGVRCLSDDATAPVVITATGNVSSADDAWVYLNEKNSFVRVSRIDGHEDKLLDQKVAFSAPSGACVFAVSANKNTMSLWRLAP